MSDEIMEMRYEFFSWRGFLVGAGVISTALVVQSVLGFPSIWAERGIHFAIQIVLTGIVVGIASGSILVFLYPPNQDIIGVVGLGSDDAPQYLSLALVVIALVDPILSGFIFFFEYFANDPFIVIWVMASFAAPSVGLTAAMFDRTNSIASDLRLYFAHHDKLVLTSLDWLQGVGPRTAVYRMGMLENAARKLGGLRLSGHVIIREKDAFSVKNE
ncbi:MAG: hypothetical protein ACW960_09030 [Candidatus Thorarchaeota archaeon]